jgi:argininosuccinate synthase
LITAPKHKIPVQASAKKPYSMDRNLLHISYEAGILEDPWFDSYDLKNRNYFTTLSVLPEDAPDKPEFVTLDFVKGDCVAVNGKKLNPLGVMKALNKIGGKHGVGRVDMVENRFVGMKSRGVYETPGGAILHFAHRQMESLTMDREVMHQRDALIPKYAELVYNGFWYAPERLALQAYVTESQKNVTGTVRVKLYKGNIMVSGRKSPVSLYNPHIATMEADPTKAYNQDDATGFIRLNALRLKVAAKVHGKKLILITRDFDFADIRNYPPDNYAGIIVLELPDDAIAAQVNQALQSFVSQPELLARLTGRLAIVESWRVRFRPHEPTT